MLSITAFTLLMSFVRKSEIYAKNWLRVCRPTLASVLYAVTKLPKHPLYSKADNEAINLFFKCSQFCYKCVFTKRVYKCIYGDY